MGSEVWLECDTACVRSRISPYSIGTWHAREADDERINK